MDLLSRADARVATTFAVSLFIIADHRKKALLVFFQNKAGQASGGIGGSVNSDAIAPHLWLDRRRVAVHDQFSMLRLARQERLADSQKIIAILLIERDARSDPSMAEEVIADCC